MSNPKDKGAKKVLPIRLIDIGDVSYLRSQTIYHGLAYAKKEDTLDTIVLNRPMEPYVCIGYHGDLTKEVDMSYCKSQGLPILRRETGGGTVYLDKNQQFVQWVFSKTNLSPRIDKRFDLFINPIIETHRCLGINAVSFPPNDVQVKGKKIVGTGAGTIGMAEVMTGNFLFDFDCTRMSKVFALPDGNFRKLTLRSLEDFMTSIKEECDKIPSFEELKAIYIDQCKAILQRPIVSGEISTDEWKMIEELDQKLGCQDWLYESSSVADNYRLVKIHGNVWLYNCSYETKTGSRIRISLRTKGKLIHQVSIEGENVFIPDFRLRAFERFLKNVEINEIALKEVIELFYELHQAISPGIEVDDWVRAIIKIKDQNALTPFS